MKDKIILLLDIVIYWLMRFFQMFGFRCGENELTQRNRYFADFQTALKYDAIEKGILPLVLILNEIGAKPIFSCEGHNGKYLSFPYVCAWMKPDLIESISLVLQKSIKQPLHYLWDCRIEDSMKSEMSCKESGQQGAFIMINLLPNATFKDKPYLDKNLVMIDVQEIAARISAEIKNALIK